MRPEDLIWDEGRAVVELDTGLFLSIITPERNEMIREAKQWSPSAILHGWDITDAQADGVTTWEIAFVKDPAGGSASNVVAEFDAYHIHDGGWIIYREVPIQFVMQYINEHDGKAIEA